MGEYIGFFRFHFTRGFYKLKNIIRTRYYNRYSNLHPLEIAAIVYGPYNDNRELQIANADFIINMIGRSECCIGKEQLRNAWGEYLLAKMSGFAPMELVKEMQNKGELVLDDDGGYRVSGF